MEVFFFYYYIHPSEHHHPSPDSFIPSEINISNALVRRNGPALDWERELALREEVEGKGFAVVEAVVASDVLDRLVEAVGSVDGPGGIQRRGSMIAVRNLFQEVPLVRDLVRSKQIRGIAREVMGKECFAVRGILFDKTPEANWKVTWHQDLTIGVRRRIDVPGFGPWSAKLGVPHVQPCVDVLDGMVTLRVHLDTCGPDNGPVNVIPGSHREGRFNPQDIEEWKKRKRAVPTLVGRGGVLVMKPLLLHASSAATSPAHRRVLHFDFAAEELPDGLEWCERW